MYRLSLHYYSDDIIPQAMCLLVVVESVVWHLQHLVHVTHAVVAAEVVLIDSCKITTENTSDPDHEKEGGREGCMFEVLAVAGYVGGKEGKESSTGQRRELD